MEDEEPTGGMYAESSFKGNAMVKAWQASGLHVWTEEEAIVFLQPLQAKYVIGSSGVNAESSDADEWVRLTLAQNAAAAATTLTLQSAALVVSGMRIGTILNNGVTFWTTVNGAPTGNVVTLTDALPAAASAGNYVLAYTTQIGRPLKVPGVRLLTLASLNETPMTVLSRQEYEDLPQKGGNGGSGAQGVPTQFFYSPRRDQGFLYVWPVPVTSAWAARLTWYRSIQDFVDPTNTADFPQEWAAAIHWNLALELCAGKSVPQETYQRVQERATFYLDALMNYDRESEPVQFGLDYWQYEG